MKSSAKTNLLRASLYALNIIWIALTVIMLVIIPIWLWGDADFSISTQDRLWLSHGADYEWGSPEYIVWLDGRPMDCATRLIVHLVSLLGLAALTTACFYVLATLLEALGDSIAKDGGRATVFDAIVALCVIGILRNPASWKKQRDMRSKKAVYVN